MLVLSEMESSLSGGEITSTFDHPELVKLGHCKLIEEVMIGEDTLIHFSGVDMGEYSILREWLDAPGTQGWI